MRSAFLWGPMEVGWREVPLDVAKSNEGPEAESTGRT